MSAHDVGVLALGAFIAALLMTGLMSAARMLGQTRMSLPLMLGTMVTSNRDRAVPIGLAMHLVLGFVMALPYFGMFGVVGGATWWLGALFGLVHGLLTHALLLPALPGMHPRMASERDGPEPTRALEPPGALGLNYGMRTPIVGILAHVVFGLVLGAISQLGST